jgi:glutathione S-transferase
MLTVHHLETSRSQRILWLLEELAVPYDLRLYRRDPVSRLAPAALKEIHPLGKSPVLVDGDTVVAESGAIIEYLAERFGAHAPAHLAHLEPARGTPEHRLCRFWMHYAEGSLMNWLVMHMVFDTIPRQPMPFFVRPIARILCGKVQQKLIRPNVKTALAFMDAHLAQQPWFAGEHLSMADFQMSFAVEAALARSGNESAWPHLLAYRQRMQEQPAYQRALEKGGPVLVPA